MTFILIVVGLILGGVFSGDLIGKLCAFGSFMLVICAIFGGYIPYVDFIRSGIEFFIVGMMIFLGFITIFGSGSKSIQE